MKIKSVYNSLGRPLLKEILSQARERPRSHHLAQNYQVVGSLFDGGRREHLVYVLDVSTFPVAIGACPAVARLHLRVVAGTLLALLALKSEIAFSIARGSQRHLKVPLFIVLVLPG